MDNWMRALRRQLETARQDSPDAPLLLLFDIDGTILDTRYRILHLLRDFDRTNRTRLFERLRAEDIATPEEMPGDLLTDLGVSFEQRAEVLAHLERHRTSLPAVLEAHRPYRGVLEVIRWFQIQPNTRVGLNTGRPESMREETLAVLNALGQEYRVRFSDELLAMRNPELHGSIEEAKVAAVQIFRSRGNRVFGMVDNEPEMLRAIARFDPRKEILLLHADTIFSSHRRDRPERSISGREYDLTELIPERRLPRHVHFIWRGVNGRTELGEFLGSNVSWAEGDVRIHPTTGEAKIRRETITRNVPVITTLSGASAAVRGMEALIGGRWDVRALQDY